MSDMPVFERYPFNVDPLPEEEGGGFAITFPDLPGCISDGETVEQAIAHGREAFQAWMESMMEDRKPIPGPNGAAEPAKFVLRLPRTLHRRLTSRASAEGVSLNSLVQTYVAEGLGRH
jgi:antitoxin HicB